MIDQKFTLYKRNRLRVDRSIQSAERYLDQAESQAQDTEDREKATRFYLDMAKQYHDNIFALNNSNPTNFMTPNQYVLIQAQKDRMDSLVSVAGLEITRRAL